MFEESRRHLGERRGQKEHTARNQRGGCQVRESTQIVSWKTWCKVPVAVLKAVEKYEFEGKRVLIPSKMDQENEGEGPQEHRQRVQANKDKVLVQIQDRAHPALAAARVRDDSEEKGAEREGDSSLDGAQQRKNDQRLHTAQPGG